MGDEPGDNPNTAAILGAAFAVHNSLGPGFEEVFYQRALAREFAARDMEFSREVDVPVFYRGERLGTKRIDFVVMDVLVEIKARGAIEPQDVVQALSYLRASGRRIGLLLNFGAPRVEIKRLIHSKATVAGEGAEPSMAELRETIRAIREREGVGLSPWMYAHVLHGSEGSKVEALVEEHRLEQYGMLRPLGFARVKELVSEALAGLRG
jgi:GxxExxY protein